MFRYLISGLSHHDPDVRAITRRRRNLLLAVVGVVVATLCAFGLRVLFSERKMGRLVVETRVYLLEGEVSKANSVALAAFERAPNDPRSLRAMGYFASYIGAEEAKLFWGMLESGHGGCSVEDYLLRIVFAERRGELELAVGLAEEALARYAEDGELLIEASRLASSSQVGDWAAAMKWADMAVARLPADDMRPGYRRAVALLRGRLGGPGEMNAAVIELTRVGRRVDDLALEALGELIDFAQRGEMGVIDAEGLFSLVDEHPDAPFSMKLDVFNAMIKAVPQEGELVMERAMEGWEALDGAELRTLCEWINDQRAYGRTLEIVSDEKMRSFPELVGPRAEAMLNLGRFKKLEEILSIPKLALPEAHRHYILARATAAAGWPVGGEDLENHLQAAESASKNAARPDVAMAVGRLAMESGYFRLARRTFNYARGYPHTGVDAERALLELADETSEPLEAADHARRIAQLLPESIDARAESLARRLKSGGELELVLAEAKELGDRHPDRRDVGVVLARARAIHGMVVKEEGERASGAEASVAAAASPSQSASSATTGKVSAPAPSAISASAVRVPDQGGLPAGVPGPRSGVVPGAAPLRLPGLAPGIIPGTGTMSGSVFGKLPGKPANSSGNGS